MTAPRKILPVILSGGAGSRLWPLSRRDAAKQFLPLNSDRTMIQETVERFTGPGFLPPVFICNADHVGTIKFQVDDLGAIIVEPEGRNTAPCAVVAALHARAEHGDCLVLLAPADHVVRDSEAFIKAVFAAAPVAAQGYHVTFGITPDHPATGFGYIQRGDEIADGTYAIDSFREKPDAKTAESYLESGEYYWNGGMFLLQPSLVLSEMREFAPKVTAPAQRAFKKAVRDGAVIRLDAESFSKCDPKPIDIALMEETDSGAVRPCDIGWRDIGSFSAFRDLHAPDGGNVVRGDGLVQNASNVLIDTDGPLVAVAGLDNVGVVVRDGRVLVLDLGKSQDVKQVVEQLRARGRDDVL